MKLYTEDDMITFATICRGILDIEQDNSTMMYKYKEEIINFDNSVHKGINESDSYLTMLKMNIDKFCDKLHPLRHTSNYFWLSKNFTIK